MFTVIPGQLIHCLRVGQKQILSVSCLTSISLFLSCHSGVLFMYACLSIRLSVSLSPTLLVSFIYFCLLLCFCPFLNFIFFLSLLRTSFTSLFSYFPSVFYLSLYLFVDLSIHLSVCIVTCLSFLSLSICFVSSICLI